MFHRTFSTKVKLVAGFNQSSRLNTTAAMPFAYALPDDIKEALEGQSAEMKTDKFWRDLAKGIDAGLRFLKEEAEAFDSVSAKEYRKQAIKMLEEAETELEKAANSDLRLWYVAYEKTKEAIMILKDPAKAAAVPKKPGSHVPVVAQGGMGVRGGPSLTPYTAADIAAADAAEAIKAAAAAPSAMPAAAAVTWSKDGTMSSQTVPTPTMPPPPPAKIPFDEAAARANPYKWEQDDEGSVIVSVPVPADAQKSDVTVVFGSTHLKVTVKGHPLQPVLDAALLYPVRTNSCSWSFEGAGAKRKLVATLEKVTAEQQWAHLIENAEGKKAKEIQAMAESIEGIGLKQWGS